MLLTLIAIVYLLSGWSHIGYKKERETTNLKAPYTGLDLYVLVNILI